MRTALVQQRVDRVSFRLGPVHAGDRLPDHRQLLGPVGSGELLGQPVGRRGAVYLRIVVLSDGQGRRQSGMTMEIEGPDQGRQQQLPLLGGRVDR